MLRVNNVKLYQLLYSIPFDLTCNNLAHILELGTLINNVNVIQLSEQSQLSLKSI